MFKLIKRKLFYSALIGVLSLTQVMGQAPSEEMTPEALPAKIKVLNFGTFHMGQTSDARKTEFDENDRENRKAVHEIARKLAEFKPTVIVVETRPESNAILQEEYAQYRQDPDMRFESPSEVELLAYELGRISGVDRIYGIDHKMGYDYNIGQTMENRVDSLWHDRFFSDPVKFYPELEMDNENTPLVDRLRLSNHDRYLDLLMAINADILTHVGSEKGFEGADEAAKFYQRNLRMYSNLNRLDLGPEDRVFILMGAAHTAFFRDFFSRSPKYEVVNTLEYLN